MNTLEVPAHPVRPRDAADPARPLRYLILRAHPGRSRADFYNCQELGLAAFLQRPEIQVGVAAVLDDDVNKLDPRLRIHQLQFRPKHPAVALISNLPDLDLPNYDIIQISDLCLPGNLQVVLRAPKRSRFLLYQGHYPEPIGRARRLRVLQSHLTAAALRKRQHVVLAKSAAASVFAERLGLGHASVAGVGLVAEHLLAPQPPPAEVSEFIARSRFVFLYVGQLNERRPLDWVLGHLRSAGLTHASLLVIGRGTALPRLQQEGADLVEAGRLMFAGTLNQSQLGAIYREVDCLVLPTRFEIFGMVCLEAVLFGLPVIASAVAGPAAVWAQFPKQVRLVAEGRNPEGWDRALRAVLQEGRAPRTREPDGRLTRLLSWETPGQHFLRGVERLLAAPTPIASGGRAA